MTAFLTTHATLVFLASVTDGAPNDRSVREALCGRYALMIAASYLGTDAPTPRWDELLPQDSAPYSIASLVSAAASLGLEPLALHWETPERADFATPCILLVKSPASPAAANHYVFCFGAEGPSLLIADYPLMPQWVSREKLMTYWDGTALFLGLPQDRRISKLRWRLEIVRLRLPVLGTMSLVLAGYLAWTCRGRYRRTAPAGTNALPAER